MKVFFLNVVFYPLFFLFSLIGIPCLTVGVAVLALFVTHRRAMRRFRRAISFYGRGVLWLGFPLVRVRYENGGQEEGEGPFVFVCNHRSASDPFLMALLPHECVQVVNVWPFRLPVLGPMARWAGYLSVNEMSPERFKSRALELLAAGVCVIAFPEGTRSGGREMGAFHGAVFRMALEARAPIVPLCISGNERIPPRGSAWLEPGCIRVRRLPALAWDEYHALSPFQLKNRVRSVMAAELAAMEGAA